MKDKKDGRFTRYISKYPQRVRISLMLIILAACALLLYSEFGREDSFKKDIYYEIITGVTFTTITVFIISLFNWMIGTKDIQAIQKEQTLAQIVDLMSGNTPAHKSIIDDIYTPEAAKRVMRSAISLLNRRLAKGYSLIAACNANVIRENFDYDININQHRNGEFCMEQILCYKRYFKLEDIDAKCYLRCGFAFSTEDLNKLLKQNIYFLREVITEPKLIAELSEAAYKKDVSSAVSAITMKINTINNGIESTVPVSAIEILPIIEKDGKIINENDAKKIDEKDGKIIGVNIRTEVAFVDEEDGMRSYSGRVTFVIPTPNKKRFYCVFADPIIGNTIFRFRIDSKMVDDIKDVDYVEILTRTGEDDRHVVRTGTYTMEFQTQDTILPQSAIIAFW